MKTCIITIIILSFIGLITQSVLSQSVDIEKNLVAYWNFNEKTGKIAKDTAGNGHHGTLRGGPKWTADGYFSGALEFDANGGVVVPYHEDLNPRRFTICAWVSNKKPLQYQDAMIAMSRDIPDASGYGIGGDAHIDVWIFYIGEGGTIWPIVYGDRVNLDGWDHVAATYDFGIQRIYINGRRVASQNGIALASNYNHPLVIGASLDPDEPDSLTNYYTGKIDEVKLYNRPLEADEIVQVMVTNKTLAVEASGKLTITWGQLKKK